MVQYLKVHIFYDSNLLLNIHIYFHNVLKLIYCFLTYGCLELTVLFNIYGPRAGSDDSERIQFKLTFFEILEVIQSYLGIWLLVL